MLKKKFAHVVAAVVVGLASLLVAADPARADVVVSPGGYGHVCSGYSTIQSQIKWQTCAWADNNEVYFTVNFSNASSTGLFVDDIIVGRVRNGSWSSCLTLVNFYAPANSNSSTPTGLCAYSRSQAAYQADSYVSEGSYAAWLQSDSLQVQ